MLSIENIWYRYNNNRWVLRGVSLNLSKGIHSIIGPNGSGKTTLLRIIIGALKPQRGSVRVFGEVVKGLKSTANTMVYVPSNPTMFLVGPSVGDDLRKAWSKGGGIDIDDIVEFLEIRHLLQKKIFELSEGQRHIVSVASSILLNRRIIVLDEPTVGLDREHREKVIRVLREFARDKIVVMASNDLRLAMACDTVAYLNNGNITIHGSPNEVLIRNDEFFNNDLLVILRHMANRGVNIETLNHRDIIEILGRLLCST